MKKQFNIVMVLLSNTQMIFVKPLGLDSKFKPIKIKFDSYEEAEEGIKNLPKGNYSIVTIFTKI